LTRTLFAWFPSTVAWLPSVGVAACSFFDFFGFAGAAAFLGVVGAVLARTITVVRRRTSVGRIRYVLYLFYLFSKQGPVDENRVENWVSFDSELETLMVVDSQVPTILGTRIRFENQVPESG